MAIIFSLLLILTPSISWAAGPDAYDILLKNYNLSQNTNFKAKFRMELIKKNGKKRIRELLYYKFENGDEDKNLIYFLKPDADKGTALLSWQHKASPDQQWLYLPVLKRLCSIPATDAHKPFMGSDFSFQDLVPAHPRHFESKIVGMEKINGDDCYVIASSPRASTENRKFEQYSKILSWIRKSDYILMRSKVFDKNNTPLKEFNALDFKVIDGITTASKMEMKNLMTGHQTILTVLSIEYNADLKQDLFSPENLKKGIDFDSQQG